MRCRYCVVLSLLSYVFVSDGMPNHEKLNCTFKIGKHVHYTKLNCNRQKAKEIFITADGGGSKHRLFNHISMNGKGQPLVSLDVIINLIGKTTSRTGVKVYAMKDDNKYPTKRKISDNETKKINFTLNKTLGKRNYTIKPKK